MRPRFFNKDRAPVTIGLVAGFCLALALGFPVTPALAAPGDVIQTPATSMELPVEIEVETGIASLKQAPLWKELVQLLENPYLAPVSGSSFGPSGVERRPGFGVVMPPLNVWPLGYNFLTGQPLRLRTSDGEVSWDQPGPMFDPDEVVDTSPDPAAPNVPIELRTVIGELVACPTGPGYPGNPCGQAPDGSLVVNNPRGNGVRNQLGFGGNGQGQGNSDSRIPPHRTVVAVPAVVGGVLFEGEADPDTGEVEFEPVTELEVPVNEEHFFRDATDTTGVLSELLPYIGRPAAEILGKALFWDMQVGSDGVQACGSCHFHAGVDNRTKNQLNPNTTGGDFELQLFNNRSPPPLDPQNNNRDVLASDFPFHKLVNPDFPGEPLFNSGNVLSDANDVMSSMGVSRFKKFVDIPPIGALSFGTPVMGVSPLLPDFGTIVSDPIRIMNGLRRVEPRNTPTFHGAAFNFDNFWDGRARFNFNGGSVFGPSDPFFHIFVNNGTALDAIHGLPNPADNELPLNQWTPEAGEDPVPARIKFSSLASQAVGPPLSEFEMSFLGRNWAKIAKKMLQSGVTPLANQFVHITDSRLGPFSNQNTTVGMPGLNVTYQDLIRAAFVPQLWANTDHHLNGAADNTDPFDNYSLTIAAGVAVPGDTNQFTQMEANFSLLFGLAVQAYEQLTIPDDTPFDQFMDANPLASNGIGQPGEQGVLFPTLIPGLVGGSLTLIPDDPATPEFDGFEEEEVFGFDIFMGGNLTAALPLGSPRNPLGFGSNPFTRTARCMLCHLGPEQTDHSINIAHGIIKGDAEFEFPTPPTVPDPNDPTGERLPAPEPPGPIATVGGLILSEEVSEGAAQDAVEVEPRNFATFDDLATPWDDRIVAQPGRFSFGDQGIYNIGLRPNSEDIGRGGDDPFGWPLSLSALTLKNIGGLGFVPGTLMANFDPADIGAEEPGAIQGFEETGNGAFFPGTAHTLQSINPGFERDPILPQMPDYMVPWMHSLPAGELHPQIDEMAGFVPNTLTPPNGGPAIEFPENMFGADLHCGRYDPATFGTGPPSFGWGPFISDDKVCPNNQSGVPGNLDFPTHGSWPNVNQVLRDGAFKAPSLRNVELTGPYFHTGSYLTLRQVVDFYMRGGDFPVTNADDRDPHMLDIKEQAFGFGPTILSLMGDVAPGGTLVNGFNLIGTFADALPDGPSQYGPMPDTGHAVTPEPGTTTRNQAAIALVKFLLSFTDQRVRYERAPFDRPEIFVPIDGTAPENTGGRAALLADPLFRHLPEVGAAGNPTPQPNFLGISSTPVPGTNNDHFDR